MYVSEHPLSWERSLHPPPHATARSCHESPSHAPYPSLFCQLLVHEATCGVESTAQAVSKGHSNAAMAGAFAKSVRAKQLVLTHFSNSFASAFIDSSIDAISSPHSFAGLTGEVLPSQMEYPYPAVVEPSVAIRRLTEIARQTSGISAVAGARDFMTFPVPRPAS
jgi:hypothetical protein